MAYTCWYSGNNLISSDDYAAATASGFEACGWDLHDSYTSTYDYKIYTSMGEENQTRAGTKDMLSAGLLDRSAT